MTDIHDLLEHAVDHPVEVDLTGDLRRGRRALHRRRTRIAAGVTGGAAVLGFAGVSALPHPAPRVQVLQPAADPGADLLHTGSYDLAQPPAGWHLAGSDAATVVFRKDGDNEPYDVHGPVVGLVGAIAIYVEDKSSPFDVGTAIEYDGRTFYHYSGGGGGADQLGVQDPAGDWIRMQWPMSAGFDVTDMVAWLDSVVVKPGARLTAG